MCWSAGLLTQALQFICLYLALMHGAPAVLGAVIISMNPVVTALLAATFLGEGLTWTRVGALVARCARSAGRLRGTAVRGRRSRRRRAAAARRAVQPGRGRGLPAAVLLRRGLPGDRGAAERGVVLPGGGAGDAHALAVTDPWKAAGAVAAVVLLNATLVHDALRARDQHYGAAAVAMLFAVIPAVAGLLSWLMLGQRPDVGIAVGLVVGAAACWLNASGSRQQRQDDPAGDGRRQHRVDPVHDAPVTG